MKSLAFKKSDVRFAVYSPHLAFMQTNRLFAAVLSVSDNADDTSLTQESKEELTSFLIRVKEESEKAGLKFNTEKTKILESDPITSWQIKGENVEAVTDFLFLGCKITADADCSHEIRRQLLLGRKAMTNSVLKSKDITLPTKILIVRAMVFPVVMY